VWFEFLAVALRAPEYTAVLTYKWRFI